MAKLRNYSQDLEFIKQYEDVIVLENSSHQQAVVVPKWQGRIMTSTTRGAQGFSYGWVNYKRIATTTVDPKINLFGGEDRFWISPEGSQFSFFFEPGAVMDLEHWRTPPQLDMQPFDLVEHDQRQAVFRQPMQLMNYQGQVFEMLVDRVVKIHDDASTAEFLGMPLPPGVFSVCHESQNSVTNVGDTDWQAAHGLPSVWMLCMNKPSDHATVIVPFRQGNSDELGGIVTADYFGVLDQTRLQISEESGLIYFLGDGKLRSKLGVAFPRAVNYLGAWDAENQCLTIVQFNLPDDPGVGYANNLWKIVDNPYGGDVINSYNDGPDASGGMMGPFYELETLSPALALSAGSTYTHLHRTFHLEGDRQGLERVAQHTFGQSLAEIEKVFSGV